MTTRIVVGKIELGQVRPIVEWPPRSKAKPEEKLHRLLLAARAYRAARTQKALDELLAAAKDID